MDGRPTRNLNNVEIRQHSSSSKLNNRANACWQRSVKRKYDNVSLDAPRNSLLGNPDVCNGCCSSEVAQSTIPRKGDCQSSSEEALGLARISVDESDSEQLDKSELVVPVPHLRGPFSLAEYQHLKLSGATLDAEDVELDAERSYSNAGGGRNLFPKTNRALRNPMSQFPTSGGVCQVPNSAGDREITQLREALKSERKTLNRLYVELEEERCASATAANEAVAMISRLQEEKAAILMEAHQYRRVAEEREAHNQEAIALLKEYAMNKEEDLLVLQDQIEAYQTMLLRIESGGLGLASDQTNLLEGLDKEGPLFLEGQGIASLPSCTGSKYGNVTRQNQMDDSGTCISHRTDGDYQSRGLELPASKTSNQFNPLACSGVRMNVPGFFNDVSCGYDERQAENRFVSSVNRTHYLDENMTWERQRFEEAEMVGLTSSRVQGTFETYKVEEVSDIGSQDNSIEDPSASILARVKRLEERFQDLGKTQAYEGQGMSLHVEALQTDIPVIGDVDSEETGSTSQDSDLEALYDKRKRFPDKVQQFTKWSSFDKGESLWMGNRERNAPTKISDLKTYRGAPTLEELRIESEVDPGEGVHDVYEVHHDIKETIVHHSECVIRDGLAKPDVMSISTLQVSPKYLQEADPICMERLPTVPSKHEALSGEPEGCEPETDKVAFERCSLSVKDTHKRVAEEGVHQLKVRLQALESERVFMNQAIDSLRKENMDLKLLQEIAQQLRELKGDVKKTGQLTKTLQQDQLSISSFFKGILSFTGLQNSADAEGNRFMWPFQKNLERVKKKRHDGLFSLLEKPQSQASACVTRGLKLRLPGSGETGSLSQKSLVHSSTI